VLEPPDYGDRELGWLPTTAREQSCALCGDESVVWLHPLATDKLQYREYGKEHALPGSWALCARCESLYVAGADAELVDLMQRAHDDAGSQPESYVDEVYRQPLAVFRRADLGARRFPDSVRG
jgi:hypothetical protein